MLSTAIVRTSCSEKPASSRRSAISASPSSTGGFATWPRSVESTLCSGPVARIASNVASHETLPRVDRREAPLEHRAARRQLALLVDGNSLRRIVGMRDHHVGDAGGERRVDGVVDLGAAEVARREDELVPRDHVEHPRETVLRHRHRRAPDTGRRRTPSWIARHTGCFAGFGPSSLASFSESTVGSQTIRAPSRAAISTACAFSPPTPALSVIAPSASTPGTAARTTAARSAVGA